MDFDKFLDSLEPHEMDQLRAALTKRGTSKAANLMTSEEMALVIHGRKLEAIKSVRQRLSIGLAEAKALVDKFQEGR